MRFRASTLTSSSGIDRKKLPTVFKWEGGGKEVCISGSFDNWKAKIPMVKRCVSWDIRRHRQRSPLAMYFRGVFVTVVVSARTRVREIGQFSCQTCVRCWLCETCFFLQP